MTEIHPLPFQEDLLEVALLIGQLQAKVHPESDLAEALDRVIAILDPFAGSVEWLSPVGEDELTFRNFRSSLQGMKL